jgi:diguanylate cyclase (GGDEF)-like protein
MPVYDSYGKIAGLLGFFSESSELKPEKNMEHGLTRTDLLTGVLNARGLTETLSTYRDEYDLRRTNFVRVDLTVDDFADMSRLYGYDYTDHLIVAISKDLLREFGQFASVCRVSGCDFVILSQFQHQKELQQLLDRVRQLPSRVREVDGIPCTLYISVGASIYSETEDVERQAQQARLRIKSDHAEIANSVATRQNVAGMFRMYDALPVAYAVYKVHLDAVTKVSDATMLYVNQRFCELVDMSNDTLVGSKVRPLFPTLTPDWYDYAYRSAILGEKVVAHGYYPEAKSELNITVNQVISPGYCAFTYIVPEDFDAEEMGAGPAKG